MISRGLVAVLLVTARANKTLPKRMVISIAKSRIE